VLGREFEGKRRLGCVLDGDGAEGERVNGDAAELKEVSAGGSEKSVKERVECDAARVDVDGLDEADLGVIRVEQVVNRDLL
jgi:hypothetical protein